MNQNSIKILVAIIRRIRPIGIYERIKSAGGEEILFSARIAPLKHTSGSKIVFGLSALAGRLQGTMSTKCFASWRPNKATSTDSASGMPISAQTDLASLRSNRRAASKRPLTPSDGCWPTAAAASKNSIFAMFVCFIEGLQEHCDANAHCWRRSRVGANGHSFGNRSQESKIIGCQKPLASLSVRTRCLPMPPG